jgi:xanthine/CO dehydrogenase XdhC/CoxF family maturation factor
MWDTFFEQASRLCAAGEPFAMATVVACQRPTAAYPGAKALIRADGTLTGWVGGSCAQPTVIQEALKALAAVIATSAGYLGLVASGKRAATVFQYLRDQGVQPELLQRVTCPAGCRSCRPRVWYDHAGRRGEIYVYMRRQNFRILHHWLQRPF